MLRPAVALDNTTNEMAVIACILVNYQYVFKHMMSPGSVENVVTVVPMEGVTFWNMSINLFKNIAKIIAIMLGGRAR